MGLLKVGRPLEWNEASPFRAYVREHGVQQFLNTWNRVKGICGDQLLYGEEIEYHVLHFDHENRNVKLSLRAPEILESLQNLEQQTLQRAEGVTWHPEYGSWMVEATPREPYTGYCADLARVERNMRLRRKRLLYVLRENETAISLPAFPLMGVGFFTEPTHVPNGPVAESDYFPDQAINPHPRFATLTRNIRLRRGRKVDIRVPLFQDVNTPEFQSTVAEEDKTQSPDDMEGNSQADHEKPFVDMDAMGFGMGMCCLQITFQASNALESRFMYDQLATLAPVMLALTAATPILKGRLVDTDVRWDTIAASVDDRTRAELGEISPTDIEEEKKEDFVGEGVRRLIKSRYDSISCYIFQCPRTNPTKRSLEKYNDIPCALDEEHEQTLLAAGVDKALATHVAHLFVRDPLVIFEGSVENVNDMESTEHFENLQSTNWQTCRWKPPPPRNGPNDPHIGWRVEFRSMEVQLTDFENAAFTVFVVLVTRVILAFDLNLYLPLSKVDENMRRAHKRNATLYERFWVRKHMAPPPAEDPGEAGFNACNAQKDNDECEEMSMQEILEGKSCYFPGLIPLVQAYLDHIGCDRETRGVVDKYLELIKLRGRGDLLNAAQWIRQFVEQHPDYNHDSIVTAGMTYDLMVAAKEIGEGHRSCPEMLGDITIDPIYPEGAYDIPLAASRIDGSTRCKLMERYLQRARARSLSIAATTAIADDRDLATNHIQAASLASESLGEDFIFQET